MVLLPTGMRHAGQDIQSANIKNNSQNDEFKIVGERLLEIADLLKVAFLKGDFPIIGPLLTSTWELKKQSNTKSSNKTLDEIFELALNSGADGGRLLGTGGGGYFLFLINPAKRYDFFIKMAKKFPDLIPEPIIFDNKGVISWTVKG